MERRSKVLPKSELIDYSDLPVFQNYINQLESLGFKIKQKSKWFNSISGYANLGLVNKISELRFVKQIDNVKTYKKNYNDIEKATKEINQNLNKQNKLNSIDSVDYGAAYQQLNQINVIAAQELGYTGQGVTICMMDAGVDRLTHEAFKSIKYNCHV